jgi:hypothetical protein
MVGRSVMFGEHERIGKEAKMTCFKVLFYIVQKGLKKTIEELRSRSQVPQPRFEASNSECSGSER